MPRYQISDSATGRTMVVEGNSPPSQEDVAELFSSIADRTEPQTAPEQAQPEPGIMERIASLPPAIGFGETKGVFGTLPRIPEITGSATGQLDAALRPLAGMIGGGINAVVGTASAMTTPASAVTLGVFARIQALAKSGNPVAQKILPALAAYFSGSMAEHAGGEAGQASVELGRPETSGQRATELLAAPAITGAMALAPVVGGSFERNKVNKEISKIPQIESVKRNQSLAEINKGANELASPQEQPVSQPESTPAEALPAEIKPKYRYGPGGLRRISETGTEQIVPPILDTQTSPGVTTPVNAFKRVAIDDAESIANQAEAQNSAIQQPFELPKQLAKSSPRYSYGSKGFSLTFESPLDKALYILAQENKSKSDASFLKAVMDHTGMDEGSARAAGRQIKDQIKVMAKESDAGNLVVPRFYESDISETSAEVSQPAISKAEMAQSATKIPTLPQEPVKSQGKAVSEAPVVEPEPVVKAAEAVPAEVPAEPIVEPEVTGRKPWESWVSRNTIGSVLKKATIVSDNIRAVHPEVAGRVREMALREASLATDLADRSKDGLSNLRKLVGKDKFEEIGVELRNYKEAEVFDRLEKDYGDEGKAVVDQLKEGWLKVRDEAIEAIHRSRGTKVEKLENYWPLEISDAEGLFRELEKDNPSIIRKALEDAEAKKGGKLTPDEQNAAIADLIQGSMRFPGKPGFLKQRTIENLRGKWSKYFEPIDVSVQNYISRVARDVSQREFLGKVDPNAADPWSHTNPESSGPVGSLIADLIKKGEITDEGADVIKENINAYLNQPRGSQADWKINRAFGAVQVAANLGQVVNAISQLGDGFLTSFLRRPDDALKGFTKAILKSSDRVKLEDISLHEGNPEVREFARNSGTINKVVDITLKPFFAWADRVGKEGFLNATEIWASRNAKSESPSGKFERTARDTSEMFPQDWPTMLESMKEGDWLKPELKKFLFNELSNIQPTTRAEMPIGQLQASPLGKIPWRLMSFTLRQLGLVRNNVYEAAKQGRKAEAASWLAQYGFWMIVGNSMIQYARDTADRKKTSSQSDYFFGAMMQMAGVNRVAASSIARGDIAKAVGERILPGIPSLVGASVQDFGTVRDELRRAIRGKPLDSAAESALKQSELLRYVPWIGRPLYTQYGAGHTKEVQAQAGKPKPTVTQEIGEIVWPTLGKKK